MKDICIITNYFPPETGAASNRIAKLALGLKERGFVVKVICPLPNYPKGKIFENYQGKWKLTENYKGVEVTRLWVYANNSSHKVKRLLSMVSFSLSLSSVLTAGSGYTILLSTESEQVLMPKNSSSSPS